MQYFDVRPTTPLPYETVHILPLTQRAYAPDANEIPNANLLLSGRFHPEIGRVVRSASLGVLALGGCIGWGHSHRDVTPTRLPTQVTKLIKYRLSRYS